MNVPMVTISLNNEIRTVPKSDAMQVADELHQKYGGIPTIVDVAEPSKPISWYSLSSEKISEPSIQKPSSSPIIAVTSIPDSSSEISTSGKIRSLIDQAAATESGFSTKKTIYERGTTVNETGIANARKSRLEHEEKPLVTDYCNEFVETIHNENRRDIVIQSHTLRMNKIGEVGLFNSKPGEGMLLCSEALPQLVNRLGIGGGLYLDKCWPELRAYNFNAWTKRMHETFDKDVSIAIENKKDKPEADTLSLRTRNAGNGKREIFATVTERYTPFDVDKIATALQLATPEDARGTVTYDGFKARFEVMFHSNIQPEDYVAGEFFKAGVIIRTDDTGGGSCRGSAAVWQNLCRNLIIIDQATQELFRIRHMGSISELAKKFSEGFKACMSKIEHFRKAWGYAVHENVIQAAQKIEHDMPISIHEAMPGLFNGIIERELVPVAGKRKEVVSNLMRMWEKDESAAAGTTRAAVVNAFTRYAHEVNTDPWDQDEIQKNAGALLYGKNGKAPAILPYVALT